MEAVKIVLCLLGVTFIIAFILDKLGVDLRAKNVPRSNYRKYFEEDIWEERKNGK